MFRLSEQVYKTLTLMSIPLLLQISSSGEVVCSNQSFALNSYVMWVYFLRLGSRARGHWQNVRRAKPHTSWS